MRTHEDVGPQTHPPATAEIPPAGAGADWRFLLPTTETTRLLDLSGRDDVALALAADVAEVLALRATAEATERLHGAARATGIRNLRAETGDLGDLPRWAAPFEVVILHDAAETAALPPSAAQTLLDRIRGLLTPHGCLWLAGGSAGPGVAAARRLLRGSGLVAGRGTWALLPDATSPREIVPLDSYLARRLAPRIVRWPGRTRWTDAIARGASHWGLGSRLVPAFGIIARVADTRS